MAARLRPHHQDEVRSKIQASQLINRLSDHVLGDVDLSNSQVRACEVLLRKVLPDLSSVELSSDPDAPVVHRVELVAANGDGSDTPAA